MEKRNHPQSRSFAYSFKRSRNTNLKSKTLIKGAFELPLPVSLPAKYEGRMNYFYNLFKHVFCKCFYTKAMSFITRDRNQTDMLRRNITDV